MAGTSLHGAGGSRKWIWTSRPTRSGAPVTAAAAGLIHVMILCFGAPVPHRPAGHRGGYRGTGPVHPGTSSHPAGTSPPK